MSSGPSAYRHHDAALNCVLTCLFSSLLLCRAISSREFWTTNPTIMKQLEQGVEDCLARSDLRCPRANPPFHYSVRITGGRGGVGAGNASIMHPMHSVSN